MNKRPKVSEPPEAISEILSIVQLLPAGIQLIDYWQHYYKSIDTDPKMMDTAIRQAVATVMPDDHESFPVRQFRDRRDLHSWGKELYYRESLRYCLTNLPPAFSDYVCPQKKYLGSAFVNYLQRIRATDSLEKFDAHNAFRLLHDDVVDTKLEAAISAFRYSQAHNYYVRLYELMDLIQKHRAGDDISFSTHINETRVFQIQNLSIEAGRIVLVPDFFTDAFNGIAVERLGLCENCSLVFWRTRTDMKGCSTRCAKILRTRKWRDNIPAEKKQEYYVNRLRKN